MRTPEHGADDDDDDDDVAETGPSKSSPATQTGKPLQVTYNPRRIPSREPSSSGSGSEPGTDKQPPVDGDDNIEDPSESSSEASPPPADIEDSASRKRKRPGQDDEDNEAAERREVIREANEKLRLKTAEFGDKVLEIEGLRVTGLRALIARLGIKRKAKNKEGLQSILKTHYRSVLGLDEAEMHLEELTKD